MNVQKASWKVDNQKVTGTLLSPDDVIRGSAVFFLHGMTSSEDRYIPIGKELVKHGIIVLTLSMRGHGKSEGTFNDTKVTDLVKDGVAAYDFLSQQPFVDRKRIGVVGTSVGANLAALLTKKRPVQSLILRAPALYTEANMNLTLSETMIGENKLFHAIENKPAAPPIKAIAQFRGSLLIVVSGRDAIIPFDVPQAYFDNAKLTKQKRMEVIPDASHALSNPLWGKLFTNFVTEWFQATL